MTTSNRIFSSEELKLFGKPFSESAEESLDAGDLEKAKYWCRKYEETKYLSHDRHKHWVARILSIMYDRFGQETVVKIVGDSVSVFCKPIMDAREGLCEAKGFKAWIEYLVDLWSQMRGSFTVEEDDEKIIFLQSPCGSGGSLVAIGAYGEGGYRLTEKPMLETWGKKNCPIYCTHCGFVDELVPLKLGGEGAQLWVHPVGFPEKPEDSCIHHVYKDPNKIPAEYYERFGLKKTRNDLPVFKGADGKRIFTEDELAKFGKSYMQLAADALEKNDTAEAKHWFAKEEETRTYIVGVYINWISSLLTIVSNTYGQDEARDIMKESVMAMCRTTLDLRKKILEEKGMKAWIEYLADFWNQQTGTFTVEEDDEKFIFSHRCGSGGRLIDMGAFGEGGYQTFHDAASYTWNQKECPMYCSSCAWNDEIFPLQIEGSGAQLCNHVSGFPKKPEDVCVHYVYKDPTKIPSEFYQAVDFKK